MNVGKMLVFNGNHRKSNRLAKYKKTVPMKSGCGT